uniref:Uncharacterized protein n=1 Tax=Salix viminalis TaxID=40686 RepID=A0A6N2MZG3_SALVM
MDCKLISLSLAGNTTLIDCSSPKTRKQIAEIRNKTADREENWKAFKKRWKSCTLLAAVLNFTLLLPLFFD